MKRYTKEYRDFLNESSLETTWLTANDLIDFLDLGLEPSNEPLLNWLKRLDYVDIGFIIYQIFSKNESISICLRMIKEIKSNNSVTLYDSLNSTTNKAAIKSIIACEYYLKGEMEYKEFKKIAQIGNFSALAVGNIVVVSGALIANLISTKNAIKIFLLKELEKFDWSRIEKEIKGHNIFGE